MVEIRGVARLARVESTYLRNGPVKPKLNGASEYVQFTKYNTRSLCWLNMMR